MIGTDGYVRGSLIRQHALQFQNALARHDHLLRGFGLRAKVASHSARRWPSVATARND